MAHQDYSEICPIFNEGVEKELTISGIPLSATLSIPIVKIPVGREITVFEVLGHAYTSDTCYLGTTSCTIGIYKVGGATSGSLSNRIASIAFGSADRSVTCGIQTGSVTSTAFTSTDLIGIAMNTFADSGANVLKRDVSLIIRYREK